MLPEGYENKVMHASFHIGDSALMGSDGCGEDPGFKGFTLALNVATEAEAFEQWRAGWGVRKIISDEIPPPSPSLPLKGGGRRLSQRIWNISSFIVPSWSRARCRLPLRKCRCRPNYRLRQSAAARRYCRKRPRSASDAGCKRASGSWSYHSRAPRKSRHLCHAERHHAAPKALSFEDALFRGLSSAEARFARTSG
jgi:hypothetical protein